jgi:hypothetical protein
MQRIRVRHLQPASRPVLLRVPCSLPRRSRFAEQPRQPRSFRPVPRVPVHPRQRLSLHRQHSGLLLWLARRGDLRAFRAVELCAGLCFDESADEGVEEGGVGFTTLAFSFESFETKKTFRFVSFLFPFLRKRQQIQLDFAATIDYD